MLASFLRNIEIWLSLVGLSVILLVPFALQSAPADRWQVTAVTAIVVGLIHGMLFWLVRRHQRQVRLHTINDIRDMLKHLINNPLCTISMRAGLLPATADSESVRDILVSVDRITRALRNLSDESLQRWREEEPLP